MKTGLPIDAIVPEVLSQLAGNLRVAVGASPGSGKSTVLPLALLDAPWLNGKQIILLQPRRIAAKSIALRMSELSGTEIGDLVGYQIRHERKATAATRILVVTEGILTRMLQADPALEHAGLLLFDEFHERSLHAELALALALESQDSLRPDLRIAILSATLDEAGLAAFLPGLPIIRADTPQFPLTLEYLDEDLRKTVAERAAAEAFRLARDEQGDLLVFLPGVAEISRAISAFRERARAADMEITALPLYGELPYADQRTAINRLPGGKRRAVFATPIAETSLTLDGVRIVVDSGLARVPEFDPGSGLTRLVTQRITADSATQRSGRAARQGPGRCLRLWSKHTQLSMRPVRAPEILVADLAPLALELAAWGATPESLAWYTPPPSAGYRAAVDLLTQLQQLDAGGRITDLGKQVLRFGAHPRIGLLLLSGSKLGVPELACDVAGLLEERDPFPREDTARADFALRVEALHAFQQRGAAGAREFGADRGVLERANRLSGEFRRKLGQMSSASKSSGERESGKGAAARPGADSIGVLVAAAYPERIAKRRESGSNRWVLSSGSGAVLTEAAAFRDAEYLAICRLLPRTGDGTIVQAAELSEAALRKHLPHLINQRKLVCWDNREQAVYAVQTEQLGALELSGKPCPIPNEQKADLFFEGVKSSGGIAALPWDDEARALQRRIELLRAVQPELELPDVRDESLNANLREWLEPYCGGMSRLRDLRQLSVATMLQSMLRYDQQTKLDELLPSTLALPKGIRRKIDYVGGDTPVFSATVQELFGWKETPQLARGKIPLLLHILSPARRPVQVTADLKGFWESSYHDVRKDLKGRYPKHSWPEKP